MKTEARALAKDLTNRIDQLFRQRNKGTLNDVDELLTAFYAQAQRDARKELLIEISQRYAAGSTGFDILTWCYSELDTVVAQMKARAQGVKE